MVRLIKENHRRVTGSYPKQIGAVIPRSYAGNDSAQLYQAGIECCLHGTRGYTDEVEKRVRIDEMVTCAQALALTGYRIICT